MEDWVIDLIKEFVKKNNLKAVKIITEDGPEAVDKYSWSVIHFAVNSVNISAFDLLLEHKVKVNVYAKGYNMTPLHMAVEAESEYMVRKLLKAGADPNAVAQAGQTPLHLAMEPADFNIVKHLIKAGAKKGTLNVDDKTPLDLFREYSQKVEALLS